MSTVPPSQAGTRSITSSGTTDANGRAKVDVKLPDNLTRYRVMAVAVSGSSYYGIGESQLTARLPIIRRATYLTVGRAAEVPDPALPAPGCHDAHHPLAQA